MTSKAELQRVKELALENLIKSGKKCHAAATGIYRNFRDDKIELIASQFSTVCVLGASAVGQGATIDYARAASLTLGITLTQAKAIEEGFARVRNGCYIKEEPQFYTIGWQIRKEMTEKGLYLDS